MLKIALAIFIIAHGLVHAILAIAPNPADPNAKPGAFFTAAERSWLLPQLGLNASTIQWIGIILVGLSTLGFVLAGLGIFGVAGLSAIWRTVAIVSASNLTIVADRLLASLVARRSADRSCPSDRFALGEMAAD